MRGKWSTSFRPNEQSGRNKGKFLSGKFNLRQSLSAGWHPVMPSVCRVRNAKGGTEPARAAGQAGKLFPHSKKISVMTCLTEKNPAYTSAGQKLRIVETDEINVL